jgi:retinol dehydrogenase 12
MDGQICMVTGATSGLGEITARELAKMGATVVMVARNEDKAQRLQNEIQSNGGTADTIIGDLSSMAEVRQVAATFKDRYSALHVLLNNAGAVFTDYQETVDGYERTFALNHLSYFLLTNLLLDVIKASGTPERNARIVNVSSDAHRGVKIDWDDLQNKKSYGTGFAAYGESKLENILFTFELARRLEAEHADVTANALHPGLVSTGFGKNNGILTKIMLTLLKPFALNAEQGAQTQIYLTTSPEVENVTGKYFAKSKVSQPSKQARKIEDWQRLWEVSEQMTDLHEKTVV